MAVAQGQNHLLECPHFLLQCSSTEAVLQGYQLAGHFTILSGYTIEESLLPQPSILLMRDTVTQMLLTVTRHSSKTNSLFWHPRVNLPDAQTYSYI
jgi:hypothetical protein